MAMYRERIGSRITMSKLPVTIKHDQVKGYIQVKVTLENGDTRSVSLDRAELLKLLKFKDDSDGMDGIS